MSSTWGFASRSAQLGCGGGAGWPPRRILEGMAAKDELGKRGERIAERFLEDAGLTILDRNWRCTIGELDLVALDGDETVFVEVKTRSGQAYGHPFEALTPAKLARLRRLGHAWCEARGTRRRFRVDAVSVLAPKSGVVVVEHLVAVG